MNDIDQLSSDFANIYSCIIYFKDGRQIIIRDKNEMGFNVSVLSEEPKKSSFREDVMKYYRTSESLEELARYCGYNCTKTFHRHFYKQFNDTPKQWILKKRELEMINLLKNTNYTFKQISEILKFKNLSHLNNFCKKRTNLTPTEIRETA